MTSPLLRLLPPPALLVLGCCFCLAVPVTPGLAADAAAEADPFATYGAAVPDGKLREYQKLFRQKQIGTKTLTAGLSQRLFIKGVRKPVGSQARVAYQAPASFAVRYTHPEGEWLLLHKGQLEVQRRGKPLMVKQIGRGDTGMSNAGPLMLLELLRDGGTAFEGSYDVAMREADSRLTVILQARGNGGKPSLIRTTLSLPALELIEIDVTFNGDQGRIVYGFSSIQRNTKIDSNLFVSGETKN
ncbi:hypothetical protein DB346_16690 [Verrucomicrobia bacterium LW23]|nr:hypothetical protein DB346_16690 [Verrucomicrobia bacterium LW23]